MITDDNKWTFIEAYLAGKLDRAARQMVRQKIAEDPAFRTNVLLQKTLNDRIEQQQLAENRALVDQYIASQPNPFAPSETPKKTQPAPPRPVWRQPWIWATAAIVLFLGIGWLTYPLWKQTAQPLTIQLPYEQRDFGMADPGTNPYRLTTITVEFNGGGPGEGAYISQSQKISLFLPEIPSDVRQWRLRDDLKGGGYQLMRPSGQTYQLDRDTYGQRKSLMSIK